MIYVASKTIHAPRWRKMRDYGVPIISTWINEAEAGQTKDFADLWVRCFTEIDVAWVLLLYREPGEEPKGAFMAAGAALSRSVPVFAVGCDELSITHHPLVVVHKSLDHAMADIAARIPFERGSKSAINFTKE